MSAKWQESGILPNFLSIPSFYVVERFIGVLVAGFFFFVCFHLVWVFWFLVFFSYLICALTRSVMLWVGGWEELMRRLWYAPLL